MIKILFSIAGILISTNLIAQDGWTVIAATTGNKYVISGLNKSYTLGTNKKGEEIAVITTKSNDKVDNKVTLNKKYVRTRDCIYKQGKIVTLTMDGEFSYENDFIFGAGSIATSIAELICGIYLDEKKQVDEKSI